MAPMTPGTLVEAVALGVDSTAFLCFYNPLPLIINPPPPNNEYSPNMVYYDILGIFIITGVGGLLLGEEISATLGSSSSPDKSEP